TRSYGDWSSDVCSSDLQSLSTLHARPAAQPGQVPPQSLAVSLPFCTPSPHAAGMHVLLLHRPSAQSVPSMHFCPATQVSPQAPRSEERRVGKEWWGGWG